MKNSLAWAVLLSVGVAACTISQPATTETKNVSDSIAQSKDSVSTTEDLSAFLNSTLKDADTLFNALVQKNIINGEFESVTVITENLIDVAGTRSDGYMAALVCSGEGQYGGINPEIKFATVHVYLAVFELKDDRYELLTAIPVGDTGGHGLYASFATSEELKISEDQFAAMVHFNSSEEGAGDYGFRKDEADVYVLKNKNIVKAITVTFEDFQFSSDEQGSYAERTITSTLSILDTKTNGLFDLSINTTETSSGSEPEESEEAPSETDNIEADESSPETGPSLYKWDGTRYERVDPA
jgi:hypothetical protein